MFWTAECWLGGIYRCSHCKRCRMYLWISESRWRWRGSEHVHISRRRVNWRVRRIPNYGRLRRAVIVICRASRQRVPAITLVLRTGCGQYRRPLGTSRSPTRISNWREMRNFKKLIEELLFPVCCARYKSTAGLMYYDRTEGDTRSLCCIRNIMNQSAR